MARHEDDARCQGRRARDSAARRTGEGHRATSVRGRPQAAGDAPREAAAEPARPRRIVSIDTSKAKALPGVRAVLTASDIPAAQAARRRRAAHAILAIDRVVFVGPAGGRRRRRRAGDRRRGPGPDRGRVRGAARPRSIRSSRCSPARRRGRRGHRGRHQRGARPLRRGRAKSEAAPPKAANVAQQARLQRGDVGQGLRRVRPHPREDLPRPDGAPGLHRAARGAGRLGPQRARSRSGRARRARSTPAPRSPTSSRSPRTGSGSSRWSAAAASAPRSARSASRSPCCWRRRRAGRCAT